jgi:hypothetical protein
MTYTYKYKQMRKAILKRDDHTCAYCGQPGNQIDHIIPISKGGEDHESNMTVACSTTAAYNSNIPYNPSTSGCISSALMRQGFYKCPLFFPFGMMDMVFRCR